MDDSLESAMKYLDGLPPEEREAALALGRKEATTSLWVPNPGRQTQAYFSEADELYYGGGGSGGKTALICGVALTQQKDSIIFRREFTQLKGIIKEINDTLKNGVKGGSQEKYKYNSQDKVWKNLPLGNTIELGAVKDEGGEEAYQGRAHDFKGFDEIPHFSEAQYRFLTGWLRPTGANSGQRCRIIAAGNPPMTPEGLWVFNRWGAWIDQKHPKPAVAGELRWYLFDSKAGVEIEVEGKGPHLINDKMLYAKSRTFIPALLEDNPYMMESGYAATLEAMPEPFRTMMREGRFDIAMRDKFNQLIPTHWVTDAIARWEPQPPKGVPMCAIACDPARGGDDETTIAMRYDYWFAPIIAVKGKNTPDGPSVAGILMTHRRDGATIIIDMGGGYGGSPYDHLMSNLPQSDSRSICPYKGSEESHGRSDDKQYEFVNLRSQAWWRFREALDPGKPGGSHIQLPDDRRIIADLCAPTFTVTPRGIAVEPKESVVKRLGRSPDRGDALVMAWHKGQKDLTPKSNWQSTLRRGLSLPTTYITGLQSRGRR